MANHFKGVVEAENHIKSGLYFSVGLTATSLTVPIIESIFGNYGVKIALLDSLMVFLYGLSFFFIGVYFNSNVQVETKQEEGKTITHTTTNLLGRWSQLSIGCFWVAGIIGFLAIVRTITLFFI